jgi:hypothetical protein
MHDGKPVVFLELQCGQFVLTRDDPDNLQTCRAVLLPELANVTSFLLASPSPARAEFEKDGYSRIVLGPDFSSENVGQSESDLIGWLLGLLRECERDH